jgi:hypothetical protein
MLPGAGLTTAGPGADAAVARWAAWLTAVVAADGLGDEAGLVLVGVGLGLVEGDPLGVVVDGLALGELLGAPEGEGLEDPGVVVQLGVGDGNPLGELLTPRWLEEVPGLLEAACLPPPPPPPVPK